MPDIPRDPRQLARDILAGKVRIEDLQRERQMRPPPAQSPQARVPLPRPVARPTPPPRPPALPQRPMPQAPRRMPAPPPRQTGPGVAPPAQRMTVTLPSEPRQVEQVLTPEPDPIAAPKPARRGLRLRELAKSKHALRQGILLSEVLGKPVSLR